MSKTIEIEMGNARPIQVNWTQIACIGGSAIASVITVALLFASQITSLGSGVTSMGNDVSGVATKITTLEQSTSTAILSLGQNVTALGDLIGANLFLELGGAFNDLPPDSYFRRGNGDLITKLEPWFGASSLVRWNTCNQNAIYDLDGSNAVRVKTYEPSGNCPHLIFGILFTGVPASYTNPDTCALKVNWASTLLTAPITYQGSTFAAGLVAQTVTKPWSCALETLQNAVFANSGVNTETALFTNYQLDTPTGGCVTTGTTLYTSITGITMTLDQISQVFTNLMTALSADVSKFSINQRQIIFVNPGLGDVLGLRQAQLTESDTHTDTVTCDASGGNPVVSA